VLSSAYSAGVRTSITIVPGVFKAVEKSLAARCWPVACEVEPLAGGVLLAGGPDEQALIPVIAATAIAAAAIRREKVRVRCVSARRRERPSAISLRSVASMPMSISVFLSGSFSVVGLV